jgi:hypothetical protein
VANQLTVIEASEAYQSAMRNVLPAQPGVCEICHTFNKADFPTCYRCGHGPNHLDAVVPITYSEHLGQMHTALRNYKDGLNSSRAYALPRLTGILWRFAEDHEQCVARACGVEGSFDLVTTVPSSTPERDEDSRLRTMVEWSTPLTARHQRVLAPTGDVEPGRTYDPNRFSATVDLSGASALLIDDTWASGGHAQCAGAALTQAGVKKIGMIVIGRHVRPEHQLDVEGDTAGKRLAALPKVFDWDTCAVHDDVGPLF